MARWSPGVAFVWCLSVSSITGAADDDRPSIERLKLMEQEVAQLAATSAQIASPQALKFAANPLLRYSDPTRGLTAENVLMDATVWRLGQQGRPTALVTLEIYRRSDTQGVLSFEFLSLSQQRFSMQHRQHPHITWDANESALTLKPLPEAPQPSGTAPARLVQMRQLAKRFTVNEKLVTGETVVCRMLSQPIDRYQAPAEQIADGALFAFANGTNPEIGLIFEADDARWSYALVRLSAAEVTVLLDDRPAAHFPLSDSFRLKSGSYISGNHAVELPQ